MSRLPFLSQDIMKQKAAQAALSEIDAESILGLGTGSTMRFFLKALAEAYPRRHVVVSSRAVQRQAEALGLCVLPLNAVGQIPYYVDGADEIDPDLRMIKGGGGALVQEKVLATVATTFVCIADQSKRVKELGQNRPLPVEVLPMARSFVARECVKRGGDPIYREGFISDNGHCILDVTGVLLSPLECLEAELNQIPGVVGHGLFATRPADILWLATSTGLERYTRLTTGDLL